MPKKTYILITFLITFGFFNNTFTSSFLKPDVIFIILFLWGIYGWNYYSKYRKNPLNIWKNQRYFYWLIAIMLLSTLTPYSVYNQPIIDAIISQRNNYLIFFLLVFLRINPTENDFIYGIRICAYLSMVYWAFSILYPAFFVDSTLLNEELELRNFSTDIGFAALGFLLAVIYFFIKIQKLFNYPSTKDVLIVCLLMLYIIAVQNRSTIIVTLPIFIVGLVCMKTPRKIIFLSLSVIAFTLFLPFLDSIYHSLMEETELQLNDENYNRWQALSLYLVEMKSTVFSIILGNGVWSRSGDYLSLMVRNQFERGTYISDIGWLGTYFYYGIFPVIILIYFAAKSLFVKVVPLYLKLFSLWIIGVPTIHSYFLLNCSGSITFAFYFYILIYYFNYDQQKK